MSGLNTKVTAESVAALRNMRNELEDLSTQLKQEVNKLRDAFEENESGLGSHSAEIRALLEELGETADEADAPVKKLQKKLTRAASIRDNLISDSSYSRSR